MKKIWVSVLIMVILLFISFEILNESSLILASVSFSFKIWKENIFPSLFPFFVLSEILTYFGFIELVSTLFKKVMYTLFKVKGECAFILIMSLVSGFPSNAKYTRELYQKGFIDEKEATKMLMFTHFSNPLFILGTVSILFLNNKEVGFLILICHYLGNLLLGLFLRNYHTSPPIKEKTSIKSAIMEMHQARITRKENFGEMIMHALTGAIHTLLMILGTVTLFLVLTTIINHVFHFSSYTQSIMNGFIEMTQGLKYVSMLTIPLKLKAILSVMILSFGGLSVHMQIANILSDTPISYLPFFTARIFHAFLSSFLLFLLFDIWTYFL